MGDGVRDAIDFPRSLDHAAPTDGGKIAGIARRFWGGGIADTTAARRQIALQR